MSLLKRVDFEELRRLVSLGANEARLGGEGPSISRWCKADEDARYLQRLVYHVADLLSLEGEPEPGFVLLDAGGGSGLLSVIACLMGGSRAVVVDMNRQLMEFLLRVSPRLAPSATIEGYLRDVGSTGLAGGSVDIVLCNEALSHMLDIEGFLREVTRVLRPGGCLVISDSNNESNPRVRRARIREWIKFERTERDGSGPGELNLKRRELIASRFPEADRKMIADVAGATFGMTGDRVLSAAGRYLNGETIDDARFDQRTCPVDPISNQCADRLFKPYTLRRDLSRHGMRARVRAHFATVPPYRVFNGVWGAMSPITLPLSRAFRIVAVKRRSA